MTENEKVTAYIEIRQRWSDEVNEAIANGRPDLLKHAAIGLEEIVGRSEMASARDFLETTGMGDNPSLIFLCALIGAAKSLNGKDRAEFWDDFIFSGGGLGGLKSLCWVIACREEEKRECAD